MENIERSYAKLFYTLFAIEALLGLLHVVFAHHLELQVHHSLSRFLNLNEETNLPSWFSSAQLLLVGAMGAAFCVDKWRKGDRPFAMMLLSMGFVFLSLDEASQLHERIGTISDALLPGGDRTNTSVKRTGVWMLILAPIALGAFWLWWRQAAKYLSHFPHKGKLIGGVLIFLASAAGLELLSNFLPREYLYLEVVAEEVGEMAGITLFLWGLFDLCVYHQIRVEFSPLLRPQHEAPVQAHKRAS